MKICFVRHGQTDANKNGLIQGVSDHPLNETGIKQAKEAAKLIKKKFPYFNAIISSSLSRAKKTAEVIKEDLKFENLIMTVTDEKTEAYIIKYTLAEKAKRAAAALPKRNFFMKLIILWNHYD